MRLLMYCTVLLYPVIRLMAAVQVVYKNPAPSFTLKDVAINQRNNLALCCESTWGCQIAHSDARVAVIYRSRAAQWCRVSAWSLRRIMTAEDDTCIIRG
ncbi:hypothetical protein BJV78DRAFT_1256272 [Lactifluus subvellereus]|nr:hypothetical protein BJV78DRAFT_1256272 [Lactifluus subvellereus]